MSQTLDQGGRSDAPYTLLVNSSDGFADCWDPFFQLLDVYWPDHDCPILLNTERARYGTRADVASSQVNHDIPRRLTWSECLIAAIGQIDTPLLLYMQEDYFLNHQVDTVRLARAVDQMLGDPAIGHIGLTKHGSKGPFEPWQDANSGFVKKLRRAQYRISTQAGLWRPDEQLSYLDPAESGWMFEIFGTRRAWRREDLFLTVDAQRNGPVFDYTHTGIIKGQWHRNIPALFVEHDIVVDFAQRGFHKPLPGPFRKLA